MNVKAKVVAMMIDHIATLSDSGAIDHDSAMDMIDDAWRDARDSGVLNEVNAILLSMAFDEKPEHPKQITFS